MLNKKQIGDLREHFQKAQNPVIFYDNDADGLCSFAILRRALGRGKGVAIRTSPDIEKGYAGKISEFNADYIFVFDKPFIGENFIREVKELNLPIVWVDHHDTGAVYDYDNLHVFNSSENGAEPVTYLIYKTIGRKEDLWLAVAGCIADHYMPDFADEFAERYPEMWGKVKKPFDAYYGTQIGLVARAIGFGLKDSTTHIVYLQNFLASAAGAQDILSELEGKSSFSKKYKEIKKKYDSLIEEAKEDVKGKIIFYIYGGGLSISAEIANELSHLYPGKVVVVAYNKGMYSNVSIRGKNVRDMLDKIIVKFEGASGGGHRDAVGTRIKTADLDVFRKEIELYIDS